MRYLHIACLVATGLAPQNKAPAAEIHGPLTHSSNPNYFKDAAGHAIALNGSQTWNSLQDWGYNRPLQALNFQDFVAFLTRHGHNFTLLWTVELPHFCGMPTTAQSPPSFRVGPFPWPRAGPGIASDGEPRFDLSKFDPAFFDRLRERVKALNAAGIYAGVYLFSGEFLNVFRCPEDGYPFTTGNNVNGIGDGYAGGPKGAGSIAMTGPNAITQVQDAYVEHVIDTLDDLPNVLWIVSEEAPKESRWWNEHQIAHIRKYETKKRFRHPIGYGALIDAPDSEIYDSAADWVAPQARISPSRSCGAGEPKCKVNVNDSDHSYWEMWKESPQKNRNYAWQNFMSGNQVLFMDPYLVHYPRQQRNMCEAPKEGICRAPDRRWDNFRDNLGGIVQYARRVNLDAVVPRPSLSSTGLCLAQTPPAGAEYLVYAPSGGRFTVDLSAMPHSRSLSVEWYNPSTSAVVAAGRVSAGSTAEAFTPPFEGDAVLYLVDTSGHRTSTKPADR